MKQQPLGGCDSAVLLAMLLMTGEYLHLTKAHGTRVLQSGMNPSFDITMAQNSARRLFVHRSHWLSSHYAFPGRILNCTPSTETRKPHFNLSIW